MSNILLVEPDYKSKFPPLGLLRIASYHKSIRDRVTFVRGRQEQVRKMRWHRIYVSSLFTYELPRTVRTLRFYRDSVDRTDDLIVGGIGATLMPEYIREKVACKVVAGPLDQPRMLGRESKPIAKFLPDYDLISESDYAYAPEDSYFCRITTGCIRRCPFCAVPTLEPKFEYFQPLREQIRGIKRTYVEKQHLVLMDNNILASKDLDRVVDEICQVGFHAGAKRNNRKRTVDFNQGIDARLITPEKAKLLSRIALSPVRLAFDSSALEKPYVRAIHSLAEVGFVSFTNYVMFNFRDDPVDFYRRMRLNAELSAKLGIRITSFPMRYIPIRDVNRRHVGPNWKWRYLRGIQCVLLATHGMVSPNLEFFEGAFGESPEKFLEIISMPDRYIIHRMKYEDDGARDWKRAFVRLSEPNRETFLQLLAVLNKSRNRRKDIKQADSVFHSLLEHHYPKGRAVPCE